LYVFLGFSGRFLMPPPPDDLDAWRICAVATDGKRNFGIAEAAARLAEYDRFNLAMEARHWFVEAIESVGVALCKRSRNAASVLDGHVLKKSWGRNRVAKCCLGYKAGTPSADQ
jgi:hypothetical protein